MKEITKNNYEAWWVDYLDGSLNKTDEERLFVFLEQNPQITESLIDTENYKIPVPELQYHAKEQLKSDYQIENMLIAKIENIISREDDIFISEKIKTDPNVAKTFELFKKSVLNPDFNIVFDGKKYLKKKQIVPIFKYASIAAVFVTIFVVGYILTNNSKELNIGNNIQTSFNHKPAVIHDTNTQQNNSNLNNNVQNEYYAEIDKTEIYSTAVQNNKIDVPEKLPLAGLSNINNDINADDRQLLAFNSAETQSKNMDYAYEFKYIPSTGKKENKFKTTISKLYEFGKDIDLGDSFEKLKIAKEDMFLTVNE